MSENTPSHQEKFFDLFQLSAAEMVKAARHFSRLVYEPQIIANEMREILKCQQIADDHTRMAFDFLYKTLVIPFDKYDMNQLSCQLDNITHAIARAGEAIFFYRLESLPEEMVKISKSVVDVTVLLQASIKLLEHLRNPEEIIRFSHNVLILQRQIERIASNGIARLLNSTIDNKEILKIKDVFDRTLCIFSESQIAAGNIRSIVLEYS